MNEFNFIYDFKHDPTHRVEYVYEYGISTSSPAIFNNDDDAIRAAMEHKKDARIVRVLKYTGVRLDGNYMTVYIFDKRIW